jgi:thioredoxin reductase (NADPH)
VLTVPVVERQDVELEREYDIAIIGGGPAGLAAGLYAARAARRSVLFEKEVTGGQIALTDKVENYPGIEAINGFDLGQAMQQQAEKYGMEMAYTEVARLSKPDNKFTIHTADGDYRAKAVIVTAGADYNRLNVPGEVELTGKGVSYCATCDAAFFKDQVCAVVGGGDAAMDEGLFVTRYASKVYVIHRRDELRASRILQERAFANPKMEFIWNTVVEEVQGDTEVRSLRLRNVATGEESVLEVAAVFIFIGQHPNTEFVDELVRLDAGGHIPVNLWMETELPGLFAAGDIRADSARQVVSAAGDGATAAIRADHYINEHFRE